MAPPLPPLPPDELPEDELEGAPDIAPEGAIDMEAMLAQATAPEEGLDVLRDRLPPASSVEIEERTPLDGSALDAGEDALEGESETEVEEEPDDVTEREPETDPEQEEMRKDTLRTLYGEGFPLADEDEPDETDWASWAKELWDRHSAGVQTRLHLVERNRLFRKGVQWVSAVGVGPWREPPKPRDAARVVRNLIAPALDQRVQVISEQRPGFQAEAQSMDPKAMRKAEAQQIALEYQWHAQNMQSVTRELAYWSGTDGVSFGECYWDPDAGPWDEFTVDVKGQQLSKPRQTPLGDVRTRVRRIEHVRVSDNASATVRPWYWIVKDIISRADAAAQYGTLLAKTPDESSVGAASGDMQGTTGAMRQGFLLPEKDELLRDQETVERYTVYCEPSEFLRKGLQLSVVGNVVAYLGPLLVGRVPIFRFTDGSTDPSFFPQPIMDSWIDAQMRMNAVLSKWVENVRLNSGPKLLGREGSIASETLIGGTMTMIGVKGLGDINQAVRPLDSFSLSTDAKELLAMEQKAFEDMSGWNDTSRGQFSSEQSGRAILAIREQLERTFAPPVNAAAEAMTEWARIQLPFMRWGYDQPRTIAVMGASRPDLARELSSEDFNGAAEVFIDPETLMPMPRALRLFLLQDMRQRGDISPQEYRKRLPFAWVRSIGTPSEDHEARARRVVEAIRQSGNPSALPLLWQDNEAIHQDVLERELILPDDTPPPLRQAALQRWQMLAQQAAQKMGMVPQTAPQAQAAPKGGRQGQGAGAPPGGQAMLGGNPGTAAAPVLKVGGTADERRAGRQFDRMSPA